MKLQLTYFTEPTRGAKFYRKHGTRIQKEYPSLRLVMEGIPDGINFILEGEYRDVRYAAAMIYDFCRTPASIDGDQEVVAYATAIKEILKEDSLRTTPSGIC